VTKQIISELNQHSKGDKMKIGYDKNENKINAVEVTNDTLSNRGGLSFMFRYLDNIGISSKIEEKFGHLRKSRKGESIGECARQFMALCMDGTRHSLSRFDELKKDPGYAAVLERTPDTLISTSAAKRFLESSGVTPILHTARFLMSCSSGVLNRKNRKLLHFTLIPWYWIMMMQRNVKGAMLHTREYLVFSLFRLIGAPT